MEKVCDLSLCLPFEGAINRTATIIVRKGAATKYPVPYKMWIPKIPRSVVPENSLEEVTKQFTIRDWLAAPVEPSVRESTWLTAEKSAFPVLRKLVGDRSSVIMNRTYAGSCTWLNGVYWVECLKPGAQTSLIRNMGDVGRTKVETVTVQVENGLLFPLLRGRDVQAWRAHPSALTLIPHDPTRFGQPIALGEMKRSYPEAFAFFKQFEKALRNRSGYKQLHKSREEFYVIGNLGNYTLAPYKVVFKELTEVFQCAVLPPSAGDSQPVIPDHKLAFIACKKEEEAHFLAGLLNSIPIRVALYGASVGLQTQTYSPTDVSRVKIPEFRARDKGHQAIVHLSRDCHKEAATSHDPQTLKSMEAQLAVAAAALWEISPKETTYLTKAVLV